VLHSIHRLSGIATPANVAYAADELEHQLKTSGAKAIFTCAPVLEDALTAAKASGIPEDKIFILDIPGFENPKGFKTVDDLIEIGRGVPELEPLRWCKGQGARQVAFLCYSSGTSGLPVRLVHLSRSRMVELTQPTTESSHDFAQERHFECHAVPPPRVCR
jgi:acyl-CoA synthetase (AMP-forming)/AMP-acid ligase II